jgi:hypothetical protein
MGVCASAAGLLRMMLATGECRTDDPCKVSTCEVTPVYAGSARLKDIDWLVLEAAAGEGASRVLPVQLCNALQGLHHQHQHQYQHHSHRHRAQQGYVSRHLLVRKLAVWSVVLDWIHVTPPGDVTAAVAAAVAAVLGVVLTTNYRPGIRQRKGAHHQVARRRRPRAAVAPLHHPVPNRPHGLRQQLQPPRRCHRQRPSPSRIAARAGSCPSAAGCHLCRMHNHRRCLRNHHHHPNYLILVSKVLGNAAAILTRVLRLLPAGRTRTPRPLHVAAILCIAAVPLPLTLPQHRARGSTRWSRPPLPPWSALSGAPPSNTSPHCNMNPHCSWHAAASES